MKEQIWLVYWSAFDKKDHIYFRWLLVSYWQDWIKQTYSTSSFSFFGHWFCLSSPSLYDVMYYISSDPLIELRMIGEDKLD